MNGGILTGTRLMSHWLLITMLAILQGLQCTAHLIQITNKEKDLRAGLSFTKLYHLCCGSAGTYSVLQPKLATELRDRKLEQLHRVDAQVIVSANIGCIQHLQSGTTTPVKHWVEVLDEALR